MSRSLPVALLRRAVAVHHRYSSGALRRGWDYWYPGSALHGWWIVWPAGAKEFLGHNAHEALWKVLPGCHVETVSRHPDEADCGTIRRDGRVGWSNGEVSEMDAWGWTHLSRVHFVASRKEAEERLRDCLAEASQ